MLASIGMSELCVYLAAPYLPGLPTPLPWGECRLAWVAAALQEEREPLLPIVNAAFPVLLGLMQQLVANASSTPQVAEFMKLICKVCIRRTPGCHGAAICHASGNEPGWLCGALKHACNSTAAGSLSC